jgi:hypothetical protein
MQGIVEVEQPERAFSVGVQGAVAE